MLVEGNLLYFNSFRFPDGKSKPKEKFFIVLKVDETHGVLGSLPTRKDSVPEVRDGELGCIKFEKDIDGFDMVCYRISSDEDFLEGVENPFHTSTHLYGATLKLYEEKYFDEYPYECLDYRIVGKIKASVFKKIKLCLKNSPSVKRGFRALL